MARGPAGTRTALVLAAVALAVPAVAQADTVIGTERGVTYVSDQSNPVASGPTSGSPAILALCPVGTEMVGGGIGFNYSGNGAVLHNVYPTTTESSEGSFGFDFFNNSGSPLTGTVIASCDAKADPIFRPRNGDLGSVGDILTLTASCPNARHVTGGGVYMSTAAHESNLSRSYPIDDGDVGGQPDDGWRVRVWDRQGIGGSTSAYAVCTDRPAIDYRMKKVVLPVSTSGQPYVACGDGRAALSAGFWVAGAPDLAILNGLRIYDGGDSDLAPDDGAQVFVSNALEETKARVYALCKS